MTATFDNLTTAIKAKLDANTGTNKILSVNYDYFETAPAGFPAAMFEPASLANTAYASTDNLRGYGFDIVIEQEFTNVTRQQAVGILRRAVDTLVAAFDADITLGGACHYCLPIPANFGFFEGANGSILWASFSLVCYAEIQVI